MKYMLLLRTNPDNEAEEGSPELESEMARWGAVTQELQESGAFVTAMGLDAESTATTLRAPGGERVLTDGPFAETKELLFSFYVIHVADLDAAIEWAAKMPCAEYGSVEIRPLSPYEQ